ncbi:MAG: LPD11 domain-containing protein [Brevinema sp.]
MDKKNKLIMEYIGEDFWSRPVYRDQFNRIWKDISLGMSGEPDLHSVVDNDVDGEPDTPIKEGIQYTILSSSVEHLISEEKKFQYMMLGRLKSDCDFYLGHGNRYPARLWNGDEKEHLEHMKEIWNGFSETEKPEWLTLEQIQEYEKKMLEGTSLRKTAERIVTIGEGTYRIGFINDEGNEDETEFEACNLHELLELYRNFCEENQFPMNTVTYVERNELDERE